jgi:alanine racemase
MDLITVNLEGLDDVGVGAPVELWGKNLSAREVADACGTIAYELFTGVTERVPREYHR